LPFRPFSSLAHAARQDSTSSSPSETAPSIPATSATIQPVSRHGQSVAAAVAAGAKGGFAGNGVMNTTLLAARFGLGAEAVGNGGTNFANGGAHTVTDVLPKVATVQQIGNYLRSVAGVANPR
jgi:hypothetical protein